MRVELIRKGVRVVSMRTFTNENKEPINRIESQKQTKPQARARESALAKAMVRPPHKVKFLCLGVYVVSM